MAGKDKTKERVRESELKYRYLFETAQDGILVLDGYTGQITDANPSVTNMLGYSLEELLGRSLWELRLFKDVDVSKKAFEKLQEEGYFRHENLTLITKDGDEIEVEFVSNAYQVNHTRTIQCNIRDITERRRLRQEVAISEARYRSLIETSGAGIANVDLQGNITVVNQAICQMSGYCREELVGRAFAGFSHPDDKARLVELFQNALVEPRREAFLEFRIVHKDGHIVWAYSNPNPIVVGDELVGFSAIIVDIDARKRLEEALQRSEKQYRLLVDNAIEGIAVIQDGRIKFVNPLVAIVSGYSKEELESMPVNSLIHPEDRDATTESFRDAAAPGTLRTLSPFRILTKEGETIWIENTIVSIIWDGKPAALNFLRDLTERRQAEKSLKASEEKLRLTLESVTEGITVTDLEANIVQVNQAVVLMHGYDSKEELIGLNALELIAERDRSIALQNMRRTAEEGHIQELEYTCLTKDKREFDAELSVAVIRDPSGEPSGFVGVTRNITQRKQIEKERLRTQKAESLGILAGDIAHDFNNSLAAILANVTIAKSHLEPHQDEVSAKLSEAEEAAVSARNLTQQLLTFAKGGAPIKKRASLTKLLEDMATFALRGSNINCQFSIADDLFQVYIDEAQIGQVISNLVINAQQAMPSGGTIKVRAENVSLTAEHSEPKKKGRYVKISVEDHGVGIAEENLRSIFDPYFTTKEGASGLGLATAYSIVKRHGGSITVESRVDVGSTFHIYLPALEGEDLPEQILMETVRKEEGSFIGKTKILVMDDKEQVRIAIADMLGLLGCGNVETCGDGRQAIEIYKKARESGNPFDVVIMDLTIPGGMGGKEATEELRKICSDVKVIVSSGYAADHVMARFKKYGFSGVLPKPFTLEELRSTVEQVRASDSD